VHLVLVLAMLLAKPAPVPFNLNTATVTQLKTLPGAGDTMAAAIVHYREKNGEFRRVEDLLIIKGVSRRKLASWKPYLKLK
jgi:competence protein ComEA